MSIGNLFEGAVAPSEGERFDTLLKHRNLVVERIVSSSSITPSEYLQTQDEWVRLARGTATIEINGVVSALETGDYVFLASGTSHTVQHASEGALWLAIHLH